MNKVLSGALLLSVVSFSHVLFAQSGASELLKLEHDSDG